MVELCIAMVHLSFESTVFTPEKAFRLQIFSIFEGDRYFKELNNSGKYEVPYGYSQQRCNLDVLLNHCKVVNDKLQLDNGLSYDLLLLPDDSVMEYSTLKRIGELVDAGAVVAGPRPIKVAGNLNYEADEKALNTLSAQMWGKTGPGISENSMARKGTIWYWSERNPWII